MAERKKGNWLFRTIAGLILLPVLYIASFGPAIWLIGWLGDLRLQIFLVQFYTPIHWVMENGPEPVANALEWYAKLF
jgi:hypothetical protein